MACLPSGGKYWKDGYDWLFKERTFFWDKQACTYRLLSSMTDAEYSIYYADPDYSALFADGGATVATPYDIGISQGGTGAPTANNTAGIFDNVDRYLIPSTLKKNRIIQTILLLIALGVVGYLLYKNFVKNEHIK